MNPGLAARLALRSLLHRRMLGAATTLGIAIGMGVVGCILIVDHNSARTQAQLARLDAGNAWAAGGAAGELRVRFERRGGGDGRAAGILPTQEGRAPGPLALDAPPAAPRGEEDYQAMRLAVRLASVLAFCVGAVIVFYTMRFSVAARSRELSLLLCLGEQRRNVALSLVAQALAFGVTGSGLGLLLAFPSATALLRLGISTTGRTPVGGFSVPWAELCAMTSISVGVALLGVAGPVRTLYRLRVADVLQPRFLASDVDEHSFRAGGFAWLLPALCAAAYLSFRPFLRSWLPVVHFFALEVAVVGLLTGGVLWAMPPVLRGAIRALEAALRPLFPLEALLVGRRMRLTSGRLVFTIASVGMVFSLLTALHGVTRALKDEVRDWAADAVHPYTYYRLRERPDEAALRALLEREGIELFRLSDKLPGELPVRLVRASDWNANGASGRAALGPGRVVLSRTLAARFGVAAGDVMWIESETAAYRFEIVDVTDAVGFFAEGLPYVELKSYALMSEGNPLFAGGLERSLGRFAKARSRDPRAPRLDARQLRALAPFYAFARDGQRAGRGQVREIDRDFLIFDFILLATMLLASIGVANNMLIQVYAREREFAVLRSVGIGRSETVRLLLVEGAIVGLVGAVLAIGVGNAVGALSVSFLDHFTLFDYAFRFSLGASAWCAALAVATCAAAALYPARVAANLSSAESLHYE